MKYKPVSKHLKIVMIVLSLGLFLGTVFGAGDIWKLIQVGDDMVFFHTQEDQSSQKVILTPDGSLGIGMRPSDEVILALEDDSRALLINRVLNAEQSITTPQEGMMVYDGSANHDCFRFYQGDDGWSSCVGVGERVKVLSQDLLAQDGRLGDVYFSQAQQKLVIHDGGAFVAVGGRLMDLGATLPIGGTIGQLFYDTTQSRLFIFDGNIWVQVTPDLVGVRAQSQNCSRVNLAPGAKDIYCPTDKLLTGIYFEDGVGTAQNDNLSQSEVIALECCEVGFVSVAATPFVQSITQGIGQTSSLESESVQTIQAPIGRAPAVSSDSVGEWINIINNSQSCEAVCGSVGKISRADTAGYECVSRLFRKSGLASVVDYGEELCPNGDCNLASGVLPFESRIEVPDGNPNSARVNLCMNPDIFPKGDYDLLSVPTSDYFSVACYCQ